MYNVHEGRFVHLKLAFFSLCSPAPQSFQIIFEIEFILQFCIFHKIFIQFEYVFCYHQCFNNILRKEKSFFRQAFNTLSILVVLELWSRTLTIAINIMSFSCRLECKNKTAIMELWNFRNDFWFAKRLQIKSTY